ncbi:hypothetical protein DXC81_01470 [Collinsella tanakaei]|jgi:hypothetical protein|uniref:Siphovirus-type tail component C-terminal domain-containing protein n=2 Tax=Collinsella tanakaei TaxID=626935 RepID=A0A3E4QYR5_9ACTN|nr:hypothetical protein DXC81_01470 [Collinsella tanakaei]
MTSMKIVRSDGRELVATDGWQGWLIADRGLEDWLELDISITTAANVLTDGSRLVGKRVEECERTAKIMYVGPRGRAEVRDEILSFLNPKYRFKAYVTHMGRTRWAEGELSARSVPLEPEGRPCRATFSILCCDPYLRDSRGNEAAFGDATPTFGFPFVSHVKVPASDGRRLPIGFNASRLIYDGKNTVYNSGDVPTMYRVRIEAEGELVNPTITKDGKHVKLLTTLKAGDVALIDFESAPTRVTINGNNALQLTSRDSSFTGMRMQVGANTFTFTIDNEANRSLAKVQVLFHKKYLGV